MDTILPNAMPHSANVFTPSLAPPPLWPIADFVETLTSSAPAESLVHSTQHLDNTLIGSSGHAPSKSTTTHVTDDTSMVVDGSNKDWETSAGHQSPVKHWLPSSPPSLTNSCTSKQKHSALDVQSVPPLSLVASSSTSASGLDPTSNSSSALDSKGLPVCAHNRRSKVKGSQLTDSSSPVVLHGIQSQMVHMNDLFEQTSEDTDAKACTIAADNLQKLEIHLSASNGAHFYDLFSTNTGAVKMYNQLAGAGADKEDDHHACVELKLAKLKYT